MRYAPDLSGSPTGSFVTRDSAPAVERYARAVRTAIRPPCPACPGVASPCAVTIPSDRDLCQFCRRTAAFLAQQAERLVGAA